MRFTTWPNAFIISAVAALSRILAANAQILGGVEMVWLEPSSGDSIRANTPGMIQWYVPKMVETEWEATQIGL